MKPAPHSLSVLQRACQAGTHMFPGVQDDCPSAAVVQSVDVSSSQRVPSPQSASVWHSSDTHAGDGPFAVGVATVAGNGGIELAETPAWHPNPFGQSASDVQSRALAGSPHDVAPASSPAAKSQASERRRQAPFMPGTWSIGYARLGSDVSCTIGARRDPRPDRRAMPVAHNGTAGSLPRYCARCSAMTSLMTTMATCE